ncbi:MAG: tetratricopeptide repeat protein, partial [Armatimonadetes bacterium]|nr:tetratricopeptide repeat protein [Armatimonadota bacterium]
VGSGEEAIQRRYRQLVRKHHPDVSSDSKKAHERFVRIQHAYRSLMDPQERARWERKAGYGAAAPPKVTVERPRSRFERLMVEGRELLVQGRFREARDAVAAAIELDPFSAEAYRLLGDIYMAGGNTQMCLELYREAELLEGKEPSPPPAAPKPSPVPEPAPTGIRVPVLVMGLVGAAVCLTILTLTDFRADPGRFAGLGCGAAFLLGAAGAASGLLEPFDELLGLADVREAGRAAAPGGLYLIVLSVISPYAGLLFYGITSVVTESYSRGILKVYGITFAVALWAWLAAHGSATFAVVAPSVSFAATLGGWLAGSFATPGEWWRR